MLTINLQTHTHGSTDALHDEVETLFLLPVICTHALKIKLFIKKKSEEGTYLHTHSWQSLIIFLHCMLHATNKKVKETRRGVPRKQTMERKNLQLIMWFQLSFQSWVYSIVALPGLAPGRTARSTEVSMRGRRAKWAKDD